MTKNTKTLLTVAGVAVVGYLLYTQFRKKSSSKSFAGFTADDDFFNAGGRTARTRTGLPTCGDGCVDASGAPVSGGNQGSCVVHQYDGDGNITQLVLRCTGSKSTQVLSPMGGAF